LFHRFRGSTGHEESAPVVVITPFGRSPDKFLSRKLTGFATEAVCVRHLVHMLHTSWRDDMNKDFSEIMN